MTELQLHGIRPTCSPNGSGHISVTWRACPEKELRTVVVPKTPGDWRSRMNARAEVRRYLKADNVQLVMQSKPRKKINQPELKEALELPQHVMPIPDQLTALHGEIADLTHLVLKLMKMVHGARETLEKVLPKEAPAPVKLHSKSIKLHEYLSKGSYVAITSLVRDTGLTLGQVKIKLNHLRKLGCVSIHQNSVKLLKPPPPRKKSPGRKPRAHAHVNGHVNGHHA
jgi:hypothetical protein